MKYIDDIKMMYLMYHMYISVNRKEHKLLLRQIRQKSKRKPLCLYTFVLPNY